MTRRHVNRAPAPNDSIFGVGGGGDFGAWTMDVASGAGFCDDRKINAARRASPARYSASGPVAFWPITRRC